MKRQRRDHVLATILYTDIVGSSRLAAELGDRRWKALLGRHHILVRKELKRFRGREIDNAGDGFLASFSDQERAIRCACAIAEAVRTLGIEIRAGLHVGQAEVLGRKLGGVVVNTGARVMSEAGPGQVVVTGVLKDLVPGSGFTFEGLGARELKGIAGRWPLYAVTGVDGNPRPSPPDPSAAERLRDSIKAPPIVQRKWGRVAIAALALVVASATAAIVASREPPIEIRPNSLLRIDAETGKVVADVSLGGLGSPPVAVPPNKIWVINTRNQTISIVDVRTSRRERVFATLELDPDSFGLAYAAGSVWISGQDDTVVRLSPSTQLVQARIPVGGNITLMAAGYGRVWVNLHDALRVVGIDPRTDDVVVRGKIGAGSNGLAIGEGSVWVPNYSAGTVSKVDPRTGRSVQIPVAVSTKIGSNEYLVPGGLSGAGFGFGFVWVTDPRYGVVYRMAPATGEIMSTIRVGAKSSNYVSGVAVADGSVWVSSPGSKTIVRINPTTDQVESRIPLPFMPQDVIVVNGDVWVTLAE